MNVATFNCSSFISNNQIREGVRYLHDLYESYLDCNEKIICTLYFVLLGSYLMYARSEVFLIESFVSFVWVGLRNRSVLRASAVFVVVVLIFCCPILGPGFCSELFGPRPCVVTSASSLGFHRHVCFERPVDSLASGLIRRKPPFFFAVLRFFAPPVSGFGSRLCCWYSAFSIFSCRSDLRTPCRFQVRAPAQRFPRTEVLPLEFSWSQANARAARFFARAGQVPGQVSCALFISDPRRSSIELSPFFFCRSFSCVWILLPSAPPGFSPSLLGFSVRLPVCAG
jgi:hypothetical protein